MPKAAGHAARAKKNLHHIETELPSAPDGRHPRHEFTLFLALWYPPNSLRHAVGISNAFLSGETAQTPRT